MSKTLFIDGQVFQSAAWDRGMGKYSLALLKNLLASPKYNYDQTFIVFSDQIALETSVKQAVKAAAPGIQQLVANLSVPDDPCKADIKSMQSANETSLENLLSQHTSNDYDYLILSLFIDQVCSVFPAAASRKILLFYDLIPLQYVERYSQLCAFPNYLKRFKTLFEADIIWSISQTVADDLALNLGINPDIIFNIDGAPIERAITKPKKPSFEIPDRFVLMPSGNDLRKNNIRAVQGFEEYIKKSGDDCRLLLTSTFDENTRTQLNAYSSNIQFTGNVEEAELSWLYERAVALLFVPEYEGLGLPILEGAEANKPIICSNIGVFNEMSAKAFYYCNQLDPLSIASALEDAVGGVDYKAKEALYPNILKRYSWGHTSDKALTSLTDFKPQLAVSKPKLAIFTPSPSGYSDIGKRVLQLHPAMAAYFDIDYYVEKGKTTHRLERADYLSAIANVYDAEDFDHKLYRDYDAILYHLGNSEFHIETIKNALYLPGFSVCHDTHLTNIFEGELSTYQYVSKERLRQEALLDEQLGNKETSFLTSLVNRQQGVITHSNYARDAVNHTLKTQTPINKVNLPVPTPKLLTPRLGSNKATIGFAGIIHPAKGLDIIEEVAKDEAFFDCRIHIFGLSLVSEDVIRRLESYPNVIVDTNVTDFAFQQMLREVDVLVNYRKDYRGETSAATLEAMRFGALPIVRKVGWYDELPEDLVLKAESPEEVISRLKVFVETDLEQRQAVAEKARAYVEAHHSYNIYAEQAHKFITQSLPLENLANQFSYGVKSGWSRSRLLRFIEANRY